MQPDNARPAASNPRITFSDDMVHFQSKVLRSQQQSCAPNATIPLITLSAKTGAYASVCAPLRRCGGPAVTFVPQNLQVPVYFWAGVVPMPNRGRADAAPPP